eukprot:CAMPEP_0184671446 /NCGR_PEP_ID=MMETSP0308-20130426/85507_1 /TAXON_ID=38269 /ORGANISM="Gloeochaete witrockiana, Strain SAG 46.84" /LENGTH=668 /DNA_ID=CAMNT_0027118577 /DNA_START=595 /DNA_END=2602 /DNA_ORIENTATION=-
MNENYIIRQLAIYAGNAAVWNGGLAIVFAVKENYLVKSVLGRQGGAYHNGLRFHVFLGVACLFQSIFHGSYFVVRYAVDSFDRSKDETVKIGKNPERTVTYNSGMAHMLPVTESGEQTFFGIIALLILVVQVGTAIFYVRRKNFRVFTWFHRIFFLFVFFAALHWGPASYYPIIAALLYLLLDRLSMHIRNNHFRSQITRVSSDIFRLDISVPNCVYAPGDWVTVKIPSLSWFEWHPFSIASYSPESPDKVTLFVRPRSRWTSRLVNLSGSSTVTVGGIYGARSTAYLEHKSIVFVVGGSGITPVIPYVRHHAATHGNKGQGIHLVWSVRMKEDAYAYSEFTQDLFTEGSSLQNVKVHLYVTQEKSIKEIVSERYVPLSDKAEKDTGDMNVILSKSVTAFMSEDSKALTTTTTTTTNNNNNNNNNTEVMVVNINVDSVDTQKASPSASPSLGPSRLPGLILALLVFGGGFLGFCIARQFQPGVTTRVCRSDDAIYFSSTTQYFLCFYYYYAAPLYLPAIVGFGLGLIWIVLFRIFSSKKRSLVAAGLHKVSESDELLADPSNRPPIFVTGHLRPSILKVLEDILANEAVPPTAILAAGPEPLVIATQQAAVSKKRDALPLQLPLEAALANEAVPPTAILAAGPEPLVIATQQAAVSKKVTFFRESWKV